eukprot:GEMP01009523.1.p1 GENE.GEMP01009523.1~~GEMP01009523.1.p1  ORF type:complete len:650 (+),score=151.46 GEMP01009523.1:29-1951(+)
MSPRILWFLFPGLALAVQGEPLDPNVRPPNRCLACRRSLRRLQEEKIILTAAEIDLYTTEIKELQSWDAMKARYQGNEHEMFKRIAFRNEHVVLPTLQSIKEKYNLHITVPSLDGIPGSRTTTSDFDVAISVLKYVPDPNDDPATAARKLTDSLAHLGDDVKAASYFFDIIKEKYGAFSGTVFDSNIYVKDIPGGRFRKTSSAIRETQDIASLTKLRRYTTAAEFESIVGRVDTYHRTIVDRQADSRREAMRGELYEKSKESFQLADAKTKEFRQVLFHKLGELEVEDAARRQQFLDAGSDIDKINSFLAGADGNLVLEAEYALYLETFKKVRELEISLEQIKLVRPKDAKALDIWNARSQRLRDDISRTIADGAFFAPEAYSSEGAFGHIVKYEQAKTAEAKALVFANLSPLDLLCSMNEQAGDFFKDVNFHYKGKPEIALYQSSKYLKRFYDAIDLLDRKLTDWGKSGEWDPVHVGDIQTAIGPLYQIRKKSATESAKRREAGALVGADSALGSVLGTNVEEISKTLLDHLAKVNAEYRSNFGATWRGEPIPALGDTISVDTTWTEEPNSQPDDSGFHDGSDFDDEDPVTLRLKPDDTPPLATRKRKSGSSQISVKSLADLYEELEQSDSALRRSGCC